MITAAENRGWPGDVAISEPADAAGLPIPSVVRAEKVAAVDISQLERVGRLSDQTLASIRNRVEDILGPSLS